MPFRLVLQPHLRLYSLPKDFELECGRVTPGLFPLLITVYSPSIDHTPSVLLISSTCTHTHSYTHMMHPLPLLVIIFKQDNLLILCKQTSRHILKVSKKFLSIPGQHIHASYITSIFFSSGLCLRIFLKLPFQFSEKWYILFFQFTFYGFT